MSKIVYFGGSFNPICHHHLLMAQHVKDFMGFDEVHFIPCYDPPHKNDLAAYEHRCIMIELATRNHPYIQVRNIEKKLFLETGRKSYTIDTVRRLKEQGESDPSFLIGGDSYKEFHTWHEHEALRREAKFIVAPVLLSSGKVSWGEENKDQYYYGRISLMAMPIFQMSATTVRERVADKLPIDFMTPPDVASYIKRQGLYKIPNPS